jgi:hypothetical protein
MPKTSELFIPESDTYEIWREDVIPLLNLILQELYDGLNLTSDLKPFGVRLDKLVSQTLPNASATIITWDTGGVQFDTDGQWSLDLPTRLTSKADRIYYIFGGVFITGAAAGNRKLSILHNGSTVIAETSADGTDGNDGLAVSTARKLFVGDFVELRAYQDEGTAHTIATFNEITHFGFVSIGKV